MKRILAILVMCALVVTTAYSVLGFYEFFPPDGCYSPKLVKTMEGYLEYSTPNGVNHNLVSYDFPVYNPSCYYKIILKVSTSSSTSVWLRVYAEEGCPPIIRDIYLQDYMGPVVWQRYWDPDWGPPTKIELENSGRGDVEYTLQIYEECRCKTTLYPKVDIEQFSVSGGPTVIQDGKVISNFTMSPGSQQVMLQVENRGFFTQKDARVRFEGLPSGVTVDITPDTQILKAHNIGTYSANFTVDPNVPSGTYQITMVAYSPTGVFDTITFEFVVP